MLLPKLYKRNSNGGIQQWAVQFEGGKYRTISGQLGGILTESKWTRVGPKNVGKANETTEDEQARLEAESKWKKKNDTEYSIDVGSIDELKFYSPMLAHVWDKHSSKMPQTLLVSTKLDGVRCIITSKGCFSRKGKEFPVLKGLRERLNRFFEVYPDGVLDAEAYNHDLHDDFNKIISLVKKTKPEHVTKALPEVNEKLKLIIFDAPKIGGLNESDKFEDRWAKLSEESESLNIPEGWLIPYDTCRKEDVETQSFDYVKSGYEGGMVRDPKAPYENKRSYTLQKIKPFLDAEFKILEIIEGDGNRSGMMGRCRLELENGKSFEANAKGNFELYIDMLKNQSKYLGKMAHVRYQNLTPDGIPRFGVIHSIRDYE